MMEKDERKKAGAIRSAGRLVPGYSDKLRYTAPGHSSLVWHRKADTI